MLLRSSSDLPSNEGIKIHIWYIVFTIKTRSFLKFISRQKHNFPILFLNVMLEWYWVCASSDKSRSGKTSALSMSLLYTSLLVLMMSYIYMTHTRTSLLIIALPISIALFHKQTHVHVGVYERHVLCVAWFVVMSCYKHSALHACQDWGDNCKKAWLVNYMHDNTFLPRLLCIFCTLQRIPEAIDSHETNSWWTLGDCTVELDWSNDIWSIAKMRVSIYKFIWS